MAIFEDVTPPGRGRAGQKEHVIDARFVEGQTEAKRVLTAWFQKLIAAETQSELVAHLYQIGGGQEYELGDQFTYDVDESRLDKFVDDIVEAAVEDMQDAELKRGKYAVRVEGFAKRQPFSLKAPKPSDVFDVDDEDDDVDELPNARGLTAQAQRLVEQTHKALIAMTRESRLDRAESRADRQLLVDQIRSLQTANENHEKRRTRQAIVTEELLDRTTLRDITMKRAIKKMERDDKLMGMAVGLGLPLLAKKLGVDPRALATLMAAQQKPAAPAAGAAGGGQGVGGSGGQSQTALANVPAPPLASPPRPPDPPTPGSPTNAAAPGGEAAAFVMQHLSGLFAEIEAQGDLLRQLSESGLLTPRMQEHIYQLHMSVVSAREAGGGGGETKG